MHGSPTTRYCDQVRSAIGPELLRLVHNTQTRFTESDTHVRTCAQVLNKVNRQACIGRAIVNLTKNDVKIPSAGPSNWEDLGAPILCTTGIKRSLYTNTSRPYFFWETNVSVSVGDALEPRVYQRPSLAPRPPSLRPSTRPSSRQRRCGGSFSIERIRKRSSKM